MQETLVLAHQRHCVMLIPWPVEIGSMLRPAKCVLTDNNLQIDVLIGGKGTAAVSTKIISISALLSAPNTFYD